MTENKNSTIKKTILTKEFRNFCKTEFSQCMNELEKERLLLLKIRKIVIISCVLWIIGNLIFSFVIFQNITSVVFQNSIFGIIATLIISSVLAKSYKSKAKELVLEKLLSFVGDFKTVDIDKYAEIKKIGELKLFNNFNSWSFDDCINGTYNELPLEIREIKLKKVRGSRKKKRTVPIFYGLYIKLPSLKKFDSFTIIKPITESCFHGERIELEDVEFEKLFIVRGSNQIEARYLITTAFMERIVKLKKKKLVDNISLSFEEGFVHLGLHSNEDYFEMSLEKSAKEISTYRKIILDLIVILQVIDTLQLDKNIGL